MAYQAGNKVRVGDLNVLSKGLVLRANRQSNKTGVTAEVGVLRLDGIPFKAGRAYLITTTNLRVNGTSTETGNVRLRMDTTGASATTTSTAIGDAEASYTGSFLPATAHAIVTEFYPGASDVQGSIILTLSRPGGTNTCDLQGSATRPISIMVYDMGLDPGDAGVDL